MLKVENLSVSYGETLILRDVNLDVQPGQVVCLMGRNGVGKTTLLKTIMGLLSPRSGQIIFEGKEFTKNTIDGYADFFLAYFSRKLGFGGLGGFLAKLPIFHRSVTPDERARLGLGYVPQGREIFPQLTVLENLQVGMLANRDRPREVPPEVFEHFPALNDLLDRRGGLLSGGQQQQLAIARALVAKPKLLILDEPTEGIQPSVITQIGQVLKSLKARGDVSILLVEQYLEFALNLADRYYVMEKGTVVLEGNDAAADEEQIKKYLAF
jgi:urea transport system ATP-binding protein